MSEKSPRDGKRETLSEELEGTHLVRLLTFLGEHNLGIDCRHV